MAVHIQSLAPGKFTNEARLAQSAERGANNATVTGSSPVFRMVLFVFLFFFLLGLYYGSVRIPPSAASTEIAKSHKPFDVEPWRYKFQARRRSLTHITYISSS